MTCTKEREDCLSAVPRPEKIIEDMVSLNEKLRLAKQLLRVSQQLYPQRVVGTLPVQVAEVVR